MKKDITVHLQDNKNRAMSSFKTEIQDNLLDLIKDINKSYQGNYSGIDEYTRMSTDSNFEWILHDDTRIPICIRPCSIKGKFEDGATTVAGCRITTKLGEWYFFLVEINSRDEWRYMYNFFDSNFDMVDKHDRYLQEPVLNADEIITAEYVRGLLQQSCRA